VPTLTRRLVEADIDPVVAFSLAAWAPVFAGLEEQLGDPLWDATPEGRRAFLNTAEFLASKGRA